MEGYPSSINDGRYYESALAAHYSARRLEVKRKYQNMPEEKKKKRKKNRNVVNDYLLHLNKKFAEIEPDNVPTTRREVNRARILGVKYHPVESSAP